MPKIGRDLLKIGTRDADVATPWAERLGDNLCFLDNIPFFAYLIHPDDVVGRYAKSAITHTYFAGRWDGC